MTEDDVPEQLNVALTLVLAAWQNPDAVDAGGRKLVDLATDRLARYLEVDAIRVIDEEQIRDAMNELDCALSAMDGKRSAYMQRALKTLKAAVGDEEPNAVA